MRTLVFVVAGLVLALPLAAACHEEPCDYPVGFCGEYPRQQVVFCYNIVDGRYVRAVETNVVEVALPPSALHPGGSFAYLYKTPLDHFLADLEAPLPYNSLYQETNAVSGLQVRPFRCGIFHWFQEYGCWILGTSVPMQPDRVLV